MIPFNRKNIILTGKKKSPQNKTKSGSSRDCHVLQRVKGKTERTDAKCGREKTKFKAVLVYKYITGEEMLRSHMAI